MQEYRSTPTALLLWPGMLRATELTEWTRSVLTRVFYYATSPQNHFGLVRRKPLEFRSGPCDSVGVTDRSQSDVHDTSQ